MSSDERPGPGDRRGAGLAVALAAAIVLFYVLLYPLAGLRVPIGSDNPVYAWWARLAGANGLGALGSGARPATVGLLAALVRVTGIPALWATAALAPALVASTALAASAFVEAALGRDRVRFVLVAALTSSFLALLADGYLSTLAFGSAFLAALACFVEAVPLGDVPDANAGVAAGVGAGVGDSGDESRRTRRAALGAGGALVAAAGLAHPLFLGLGACVIVGGLFGLVPAARRERRRGVPVAATTLAGIALASIAGAAVAALGGLSSNAGWGSTLPTSRDAVLRRAGLGRALRASYLRKLWHDVSWYRAVVWIGLATTSFTAVRGTTARAVDDRGRFLWGALLAWIVVAAAGAALLVAGVAVPGQRLVDFCLPLPVLAGVGLATLVRARGRPAGQAAAPASADTGRAESRTASAIVIAIAAAALFAGLGWARWFGERPLVSTQFVAAARTVGAALAETPTGTPLIVVADDRGATPGIAVERTANFVRASVPPSRVPDVHLFIGAPADLMAVRPSLTGNTEHDLLSRDSLAEVRPLLAKRPLILSARAFDPSGYATALAIAGDRVIAPGLVALRAASPGNEPPPAGGAMTRPGAGPMSPWLPVWAAPLFLTILAACGWPFVRLAIPNRSPGTRMALAPAGGAAAIGLVAVAVDATGLRLSSAAGWLAVGLPVAVGWISLWYRLRLRPQPSPGCIRGRRSGRR